MTHHEINEAIARSLGWRAEGWENMRAEEWGDWVDADGRGIVELPDFAASQDALDRWVQPEVERRGWLVDMVFEPRAGWWVTYYADTGRRLGGVGETSSAALARCLAWLEAVAAAQEER